jgi:ribonuclease VapC
MVVDTSAIFAVIAREPDAERYRDALKGQVDLFMSAVTVFECRTVVHRRLSPSLLGALDDFMRKGEVQIVPFDSDHATLAFAAYRRFGKGSGHKAQLNLGDCAAYALATSLDLPLLFKGDDFGRTDVRPALP